jgi:hypothetical protein
VQHGAVYRGEIGQQLRVVHLDIADDGGARLGDYQPGLFAFDVVRIRQGGKLPAETNVEYGIDTLGFEKAVKPKIIVRENREHGGRSNGDYFLPLLQVLLEALQVVNYVPRIVSAHNDAVSATYAKVVVDSYPFI